MEDRVFVVEFIGVSGSGKTTLCQRVATLLQEQGEPVRYNLRPPVKLESDRSWVRQVTTRWLWMTRLIGAFCVAPLRSVRFLVTLFKTRQASLRDLLVIKSIWSDYVLQSRKFQSNPGTILLDEALFHLLWACLLHSRQRPMVKKLAELEFGAGLPDLVICIEAEPATIKRRLQLRRGRTRLERSLLTGQREQSLARAVEDYKAIRAMAESLAANGSGLHVITVTNDEDEKLDEVARFLVHTINRARARARSADDCVKC